MMMMNNQNMMNSPWNMCNQMGMNQKSQMETPAGPLPNNSIPNNSMSQNQMMGNYPMQMPMFCNRMMNMTNWPMGNNMKMMGNMGMPLSNSVNVNSNTQ